MKRDDYLKLLRDNDVYKAVLSQAKDPTEQRFIAAHTENFVMTVYKELFEPVNKLTEKDPDALMKAVHELRQNLIMSSSKGK